MANVMCIMPTRDRPMVAAWNALYRAANRYCRQDPGGNLCKATIQPGQPRDFNRNRCCALFLETADAEWMLMVDDDTNIPEDAISKLMAVGKPVVSGVQPLWLQECLVANVMLPSEDGERMPWPDYLTWRRPDEPFRIGFCGFGCVLVRRDVIEAIGHPWFVESYGDVWGKGNKTEDIDFCQRAASKGFEIWCEPTVLCGHHKSLDLTAWLPRKQINLTVTRPTTAGE